MICIMEYDLDDVFTGRLCRTDAVNRESLAEFLSMCGIEITVTASGWATGHDPRYKCFVFRSAMAHQPGTEVELLELFA